MEGGKEKGGEGGDRERERVTNKCSVSQQKHVICFSHTMEALKSFVLLSNKNNQNTKKIQ